jgi:hypothetical protein
MDDVICIKRIAQKRYSCDDNSSRYCSPIEAGHAYLSVTALPRKNDAASDAGRPLRMRECAYCAAQRGRDYLLEPMPTTQNFRFWEVDSERVSAAKERTR